MLDSITLTRVPGTGTVPDSWTIALVSGTRNATITIANVATTSILSATLSKVLLNLDLALNLTGGGVTLDASKL